MFRKGFLHLDDMSRNQHLLGSVLRLTSQLAWGLLWSRRCHYGQQRGD
jgi:hypothetical protein